MVKTYKPATERQIKSGKGVSTDELSFKEALKYFQARGKEKDMNRFRHKGKVYDLTGKEITPKAAPKAAPKVTKPKEKPVTKDAMAGYRKGDVTTTSLDKPKGGRGDDRMEAFRRRIEKAIDKSEESPSKKDNSGLFVPAAAAAVASRSGNSKPTGKPYNPKYTGQSSMKEGFQGKYGGEVARTRGGKPSGRIGGINPSKTVRNMSKGGRRKSVSKAEDFNPFLN